MYHKLYKVNPKHQSNGPSTERNSETPKHAHLPRSRDRASRHGGSLDADFTETQWLFYYQGKCFFKLGKMVENGLETGDFMGFDGISLGDGKW